MKNYVSPRRQRIDFAATLIRDAFYSSADTLGLTTDERRILTTFLANDRSYYPIRPRRRILSYENSCLQIAPERYSTRKDRCENPVDFTRRVYAGYYFAGLKRGDLQRLDCDLWDALRHFERLHPARRLVELPPRKYPKTAHAPT